ncbi:MAG: type IX secretion system sortase PorU [bacterium]
MPLFFISTVPIKGEESSANSIQILRSSERSLTISITPQKWLSETVEINGEEFTFLDFLGANFIETPGSPQIPYHVAIIGMPIGSHIRYRILESDFEVQGGLKLLPHPQIKKVENWPQKEYILNKDIYNSTETFPTEIVKIDEPAFFRDQQIVRIQVAGLQYFPDKNQILKYNRIVLLIEFVGGKLTVDQGPSIPTKSEELLYKSAVLNYEQATRWRKKRAITPQLDKSQSIFNNGTWYKFKIQEEGIYKIDGQFLESNGINLSQINPQKIRIYNNGGRELLQDINAPRPDQLIENAIIVEEGGDGRFDQDDYILFYGLGVDGWDYDSQSKSFAHYINHYGFDNIYWLTWDGEQDGRRMKTVISGPPNDHIIEKYQGKIFVEEELQNPLRSGLYWFGWQFASDEVSRNKTFNLELSNAVAADSVLLKFRLASITSGIHRFSISVNNISIGNHQFSGTGSDLNEFLVMRPSDFTLHAANVLSPANNTLEISYSPSSDIGQAVLDWFEIYYTAQLSAVDDELAFTVFTESGFQTYRIGNFTNSPVQLFDVTDFSDVKQIVEGNLSSGSLTFTDFQELDLPKRYLALNPSKYKSVQSIERINIRDLRSLGLGAEFIIITHEDFYSEALRLESLRENGNPDNRMETEVVRISEIYDNFSGGLLDPTAIRDFLKYTYDHWNPRPAYVLLFGDGDYDYKNIISGLDKNWIPTFQTTELRELANRTTDSWFTYVSGNDQIMDMAIGRINAQSLMDAKNVVDKIIAYETQPLRGSWHNTITMVGDDELVAGGRPSSADVVHITQTETIAENSIPDCFDVEKIYLTEFPKVFSASVSGVRKPAAQEALIRQINRGTLIVNYIGHGNSIQWAHEVVFHQTDNERVQNFEKLIFFMAATCDWALFDNPQNQSQAEELLLAENRGAIAILSSARLVFSNSNFRFNQFYYNNLFSLSGETTRIGDAFILTRIITGNITNDEKFHLYGDPTLRLAVPKHQAVITSMTPDSIVALNTIEINGEVRRDGQLWSDFNGKVLINTFDSKKFVQNIPDVGSVQTYFLPGNSIFRGATTVQNGQFSARFIVPKDISYGGKQARMSVYFWNNETDGAGCREDILVSSSTANLVDTEGPEIRIYFKGQEEFTTGDIIDENVTLVVDVADTVSGVNIAGEIGHRLNLIIDPNQETCLSELNRFLGLSNIELTDLFRFNEGDHLRGKVEFPLNFPKEVDVGGRVIPCVTPGGEDRHTLMVKAWDNANNSSKTSVEVLVVHEDELVLKEVMNYPNPFTDKTTFSFISNRDAEIQIKIYTISGQLIRTLEYPFARSGFNIVEWDGRDADGDIPANGVYLYKLIVKAQGESGNIQKEIIGRLAILR